MKKIATIIILIVVIFGVWQLSQNHANKFKLAKHLLVKPLYQIRQDFAGMNCSEFSDKEKEQGYFEAFVTGYCKPKPSDFTNRHDFLCAVALNCSCPNGRGNEVDCFVNDNLSWSSCLDFGNQENYCHLTASQVKPGPGHIAADWQCFQPNSEVQIGKQIYTVTDKGSVITGRRFDIWFDNCHDAFQVTGIYDVKIN